MVVEYLQFGIYARMAGKCNFAVTILYRKCTFITEHTQI